MRLLLVSTTYPPRDISGVGALVCELAKEARRRGHEVTVLTRGREAEGRGVTGLRGSKALFPLIAAWTVARRLGKPPPEVVHVHESDGALVSGVIRVARALGRPLGRSRIVATLQVSYRRERLAVRRVRDRGSALSTPTLGERLFAWFRAPALAALGRLTARLADAIVAPSRVTARELAEDYGCALPVVVANGVPPLSEEQEPSDPSTVLYVGRLRTRKAVAVLLEAMSMLRATVPGARLDIVGSGEQESALRRRCAHLRLEEQVRFLGRLSRPEIGRLYARCTVVCLPSIYEGLPVTLVEAMAAGAPIVASRVSGIPEAVVDGETGVLVPPEDAAALATALERLLSDRELAAAMGRAGRERYERLFAIDVIADRYMQVYEQQSSVVRQ